MRIIATGLLLSALYATVVATVAGSCEIDRVDIQVVSDDTGSFVQDQIIAYDRVGNQLWLRWLQFSEFHGFGTTRYADAWLESGAVDTTVVAVVNDHGLRVFDCGGQVAREALIADRIPQRGWEVFTAYRMSDGRTLRAFGADHVGEFLRAFAIEVPIAALLDSTTTAVPDSAISTLWEWPTDATNGVWDTYRARALDLDQYGLDLGTARRNPFYDGSNTDWYGNARYLLDPQTGAWQNDPCQRGDAARNQVIDAGDASRVLHDLLDYSRGSGCRDPRYPVEDCRVNVNGDSAFDIEDVVDIFGMVAGREVSTVPRQVELARWNAYRVDDTGGDRVLLQLAAADSVLGYHLRFEGAHPDSFEVSRGWRFVEGERDGCPMASAVNEILAAGFEASAPESLLTIDFDTTARVDSLRIRSGAAVGAGGVRYEWPDHSVAIQSVDLPPDSTPSPTVVLHQNHPNPFNPGTTIELELPRPTHVRLDVFDLFGRHVIRLLDSDRPRGTTRVLWTGVDADGSPVASGVYLYRSQTADGERVAKMVLLR